MRLGVDFGTTRIVVAAVDRGNYPVVSFEAPSGEVQEWFPALIAVRDGECLFGWSAWSVQEDPQATIVRSIKRFLSDAGPETWVEIAGQRVPMLDLLSGLTGSLRKALYEASSLNVKPGEPLEIMLGVPANANGNQRFLTVEAFRRSGFEVLGLLNEPSAASIEYGHALRAKHSGKRNDVILVYDFGGGTFDASLVEMEENRHSVIASEGIPTLGGDDFDDILAELALEAAGVPMDDRDSLTQSEWFRLHEECRRKKEALHPNTRRIVLELEGVRQGLTSVSLPVAAFQERCAVLIDETVHAVDDLLRQHGRPVDAIYVTGGASELPFVSRILRENYARRVRRSAYCRSATAIGLAIQADTQAGYLLREKFTRFFGVWREADCGHTIIFDPLFARGTSLPVAGEEPLRVSRRYHPAHNIGHFRYLECSHTTNDGRPTGEVTLWDEIFFPFDHELNDCANLSQVPIRRFNHSLPGLIEEAYECDAGGAVTVTISNLSAGYKRSYRLGRWAVKGAPIVPGKTKRKPAGRKS
jgi:molecular chaperone DnaK (HSP70)